MGRRDRTPSRRGCRIHPPSWACGERRCWAYEWQPVSAMGEYDDLDVAMGDLEAHYNHEHPDLVDEDVEVSGAAELLLA